MHIMKYLFPRQFGLHNVFTSNVDPRETGHQFKDYTLREQEILQKTHPTALGRHSPSILDGVSKTRTSLPRRLRGLPVELVKKLQKNHMRCSYVEMLKHYCGDGVCFH